MTTHNEVLSPAHLYTAYAVNNNSPTRQLNAQEQRTIASLLLYKASTLRTTEAWIKERAERAMHVSDLFKITITQLDGVEKFLIEFEDHAREF